MVAGLAAYAGIANRSEMPIFHPLVFRYSFRAILLRDETMCNWTPASSCLLHRITVVAIPICVLQASSFDIDMDHRFPFLPN
jgi:hypothetical protein